MLPAADMRAALKVDDDTIWTRAIANTRSHLNVKPTPLTSGRPLEITTGEGLAASLLMLDDFWDSPVFKSNGPLVVAVFARDDIFVASLSDESAVRSLRKLTAGAEHDPNGLTSELLVRRNGRWDVLR